MQSNVQTQRHYSMKKVSGEPVVAGTLRLLLGLTLMFAGLYATAFGQFQGHGLGFFLMFAAPLIMFKDQEDDRKKRS